MRSQSKNYNYEMNGIINKKRSNSRNSISLPLLFLFFKEIDYLEERGSKRNCGMKKRTIEKEAISEDF